MSPQKVVDVGEADRAERRSSRPPTTSTASSPAGRSPRCGRRCSRACRRSASSTIGCWRGRCGWRSTTLEGLRRPRCSSTAPRRCSTTATSRRCRWPRCARCCAMIEEKQRLVQLLDAYMDGPGLTVVIGTEHSDPDLHAFSLVAATYQRRRAPRRRRRHRADPDAVFAGDQRRRTARRRPCRACLRDRRTSRARATPLRDHDQSYRLADDAAPADAGPLATDAADAPSRRSAASATSCAIACCARPPIRQLPQARRARAARLRRVGRRRSARRLLAVLDDFERALAGDAPPEAQAYRRGIELIHHQLLDVLRKRGVTPIEALGQTSTRTCTRPSPTSETPGAPRRRDRRGAAPRLSSRRPAAAAGDGEGGQGIVSDARLLRGARGRARRQRRRDQERVPQARAEVPPRPQPRRPRRRGPVQGGGRSLRGARRRRASAPATTASAMPASKGSGAGLRSDRLHRLRGHPRRPRRHLRLRRRLRRRPPARRPAARRRPALRPRDHLRASRPRATRPRCRFRARKPARPAAAPARPPGTSPTTCGQCRGTGQLRYQQGFFTVARTCGSAAARADRHQAVRDLPRRGPDRRQRKLTVKIPAGIATGQRLRLQGEGEDGGRGGPAGDLYVVVLVQERSASSHRDGNDLLCETAVQLHDAGARRRDPCPASTARTPLKIPRARTTGTTFRVRGKGMPDVSGRGKGDLLVTVRGTTPRASPVTSAGCSRSSPPRSTPKPADDDKGLFGKVKDIFG